MKPPRTCRQCGRTFWGGPRAWYCPECRKERQAAQQQAYQALDILPRLKSGEDVKGKYGRRLRYPWQRQHDVSTKGAEPVFCPLVIPS